MDASNRKNIAILAFTLIVVMLGYGLIIPMLPFYIEKLRASGGEMGLLISISALLELLFGPVWGGVSDRVGRKPVLLLGVFGYALSSLLFGLSTEVWMALCISHIVGCALVSGVCDGAGLHQRLHVHRGARVGHGDVGREFALAAVLHRGGDVVGGLSAWRGVAARVIAC
jgi:MFS family permease